MTLGEALNYLSDNHEESIYDSLGIGRNFYHYMEDVNYYESMLKGIRSDFSLACFPDENPFIVGQELVQEGVCAWEGNEGGYKVEALSKVDMIDVYDLLEGRLEAKGIIADFYQEEYREERKPYEDWTNINRYLVAYCLPKENAEERPLTIQEQERLHQYKEYLRLYEGSVKRLIEYVKRGDK